MARGPDKVMKAGGANRSLGEGLVTPGSSTARCRWSSLACLLVTVCTSAVTAQPAARFDLTWSGPPGCPTVENVQARVDALLGGGRSPSSFADVRASGQVERVDNGFRLLLTMGVGSTPSSRVIEARTCDELAGAAAIAIALLARSTMESASEPVSSTAASDGTPGSSAPSGGDDAPPPPPPPKPDAAPSKQEDPPAKTSAGRLRLFLDAPIGLAGWGSLPATGLGLGAGVGVRWRALRVTARGELWQPQTEQISGFASRFTLQSGRTEACLVSEMHGFELGPCLGAAVQRMSGEGASSAIFSARSKTSLWFAGVGGIFASVPTPGFAHLRFFGGASVLVSPSRPRFVIDQLGPVNEPALAAPQVDLGCEWIF
jgi:hypothetical protein